MKMIGCDEFPNASIDAATAATMKEFLDIARDLDALTQDVQRSWIIK